MGDILNKLEKKADLALKSKSVEEGISLLAEAFALFSDERHRLQKAYKGLNEEFKQISEDLNEKHKSLSKNIEHLNFVTKYLNNILSNINEGILFISKDGAIKTFNKEAERLLDKKGLEGKRFWNHFSNDFFGFSMADSLQYGLSYNINFFHIKNLKQVEIATKYLASTDEKHQGLLVMIKDITEIEELKKKKNREGKMSELGKMAATVAHEIKNPLGAIRGYASLLHKDLEGNEALKEKAEYILEASKSLERVVNSILQFSRPFTLKKTKCDLCNLLKDLTKSIKIDTSFSKEVTISLHLPMKSFEISIDRDLVKLCLLNIISNAYQAMGEKGNLEICLIQRNEGCLLSFSDTGCGMTQIQMDHIFSPFFTTKEEGNGLGLSETKKIIEEHSGTIEVTSQLNVGSTFTIYLPK